MIKNIVSITLRNLRMDDLQDSFNEYAKAQDNENPGTIAVKLTTNTDIKRFNKTNPNRVSLIVKLNMDFGGDNKTKLGSILTTFEVKLDVDREDKNLDDSNDFDKIVPKNDVLNIVEPYFRELIDSLMSKTELSLAPIPYHFWEN